MLLVGKVLLTFAVLGIGVVPVRADLNHTHATNPLWTAHARYHVVWQVLSYVGLAIVALGVLWGPAAESVPSVFTPSQLMVRNPVVCGPTAVVLSGPPMAALNAASWADAAVVPAPL